MSGAKFFESELFRQLDRFDERLRGARALGWLLWTRMLRTVAVDEIRLRKDRDASIYKELMLLEDVVRDRPLVVERVRKLKGMLSVLCLGLSVWMVFQAADAPRRSCGFRSGSSVRAMARGARKGELELL